MFRKKSLLFALTTVAMLSLSLSLGSMPVLAQKFTPPTGRGLPGRREGAGTRGPCLMPDASRPGLSVTALMPESNFGLTTMAYPTFFWYVPANRAKSVEFTLSDEEGREVYRTSFNITGEPGVMSISLPSNGGMSVLEVDRLYQWRFNVLCGNTDDTSGTIRTSGWVQRVQPSSEIVRRLQTAGLSDRVVIYAQSGLWYDALLALSELRRNNPTDPIVAANWNSLLTSVDLAKIAKDPLVSCCQASVF